MTGVYPRVPWQARLGAKVLLSPVPYPVWQRMGWFRHGAMRDPAYVRGVVEKHLRFAGPLPPAPVVLELGPGDSVGSALFASAGGASQVHLIDRGAFATRDLAVYRAMSAWATEHGIAHPDLKRARSFEDVLAAWRATYRVHGVRSLSAIPTASVDHVWSNAVLQHIRRDDVPRLASELRRILKSTGVSTHTIDLRDMLGGALNHLRIPAGIWNSRLVARSGAYTNRLRCSQLIGTLASAGFDVEVIDRAMWDALPTPRAKMQPAFRDLSDEDLRTYHVNIVLRPLGHAPPGGEAR